MLVLRPEQVKKLASIALEEVLRESRAAILANDQTANPAEVDKYLSGEVGYWLKDGSVTRETISWYLPAYWSKRSLKGLSPRSVPPAMSGLQDEERLTLFCDWLKTFRGEAAI